MTQSGHLRFSIRQTIDLTTAKARRNGIDADTSVAEYHCQIQFGGILCIFDVQEQIGAMDALT